jgi:hypothetical protein
LTLAARPATAQQWCWYLTVAVALLMLALAGFGMSAVP